MVIVGKQIRDLSAFPDEESKRNWADFSCGTRDKAAKPESSNSQLTQRLSRGC